MPLNSFIVISFIATLMFIGISGAVIMLIGRTVAIGVYKKTTLYFSLGFICITLLASYFLYLTKSPHAWLSAICLTLSSTLILIGFYFFLFGIANRTYKPIIKKRYIALHCCVFAVIALGLSHNHLLGDNDIARSLFVSVNYIGITVMMFPYVKLTPRGKTSMGEYCLFGVLCISILILVYYAGVRIYTDNFLEYITYRAPIQIIQIHLWVLGVLLLLLSDMVTGFRRQAFTDHMTNLYNRSYFTQKIEKELQGARNSTHALILCDIDFFKNINDSYGHATGDQVIERFARLLKEITQHTGVVARLGGEEFALYLSNTNKTDAVHLAERIRTACEALVIKNQTHKLKFTVSFGVVEINKKSTLNNALKEADTALYQAKNTGRNRVVVYTQAESL